MKGLIIEDEYNLADAIASMLRSKKYDVDIRTDGMEGLDEALTDMYDLKKVLNKKEVVDEVILKIKYASKNTYKEKEVKITLK